MLISLFSSFSITLSHDFTVIVKQSAATSTPLGRQKWENFYSRVCQAVAPPGGGVARPTFGCRGAAEV